MSPKKVNTSLRGKKESVRKKKGRTESSIKWLRRQINDPYVTLSKEMGYRSRAAFKILEIDKKFNIFKKGQKVIDLGSAPGGWSQVAVKKVGRGNILALDILEMQNIDGVEFLLQDFLAEDAVKNIQNKVGWHECDVVISDMASNTTGENKTDHLRTIALLEQAIDFAINILRDGGSFVGKVFMGGTEKELLNKLKKNFKVVKHFKPESSRKDSIEFYVIAKGFKGKN